MVLLLTLLVALASTDGAPDTSELALALGAMLTSQLAIGWSNDYLDREVDAKYQPGKPVPSGLIDARLLPPAVLLALLVAAVAGLLLGAWPALTLAVGTACGLAYNFGLKATRLSWLPFLVAFTVLPVFVWTSLDVYQDTFLALYAIALTLPVAAHLANVLPDLEGDRAQGRMTVAVTLGRSRTVTLLLGCLIAPIVLVALSLGWLEYDYDVLVPMLLVYLGLAALASVLYRRGERKAEVWAFRCVVVAGVLFGSGWLAAV
jgi:4-hydroxybenzoate polyprenyltransferase